MERMRSKSHQRKNSCLFLPVVISEKEDVQCVSSRSYNLEPELLKVGYAARMGNKGDTEASWWWLRVIRRIKSGNSTKLVFPSLGCLDSRSDQNYSQDNKGMVASFIITNYEEEHILGLSVLPEVVKDSQNDLF